MVSTSKPVVTQFADFDISERLLPERHQFILPSSRLSAIEDSELALGTRARREPSPLWKPSELFRYAHQLRLELSTPGSTTLWGEIPHVHGDDGFPASITTAGDLGNFHSLLGGQLRKEIAAMRPDLDITFGRLMMEELKVDKRPEGMDDHSWDFEVVKFALQTMEGASIKLSGLKMDAFDRDIDAALRRNQLNPAEVRANWKEFRRDQPRREELVGTVNLLLSWGYSKSDLLA